MHPTWHVITIMVPSLCSNALFENCLGGGAVGYLGSLKVEEAVDETNLIQSVAWRTSTQLAIDYGFNAAAESPCQQALLARDASVRTCMKTKWTMAPRAETIFGMHVLTCAMFDAFGCLGCSRYLVSVVCVCSRLASFFCCGVELGHLHIRGGGVLLGTLLVGLRRL